MKLYLILLGCKVGSGLKCLRLPSFKDIPKGNSQIGDKVSIGQGVIFEITRTGSLEIGDRCTLGDYSRYSSIDKITIGKAVAIAEHVSIRVSFHKTACDQNTMDEVDEGAPISIAQGVITLM